MLIVFFSLVCLASFVGVLVGLSDLFDKKTRASGLRILIIATIGCIIGFGSCIASF